MNSWRVVTRGRVAWACIQHLGMSLCDLYLGRGRRHSDSRALAQRREQRSRL
jgi:hypothetical protein